MGMFDYVSVADTLPMNDEMVKLGLNNSTFVYQTKDMHCCLKTYIIQGGRLFEQKYKTNTWVDDKSSFLGGYMKREEPYLQDMQYHGTLNFYHLEMLDGVDCWIEYNAVFTHGVVEKIELVQFRVTDNTEKKEKLEKIFEEAERNHRKWHNKYLFHTKSWRKMRVKLCNCISWLEYKLANIRMNLP